MVSNRLIAAYLFLQAAAGSAWWLTLWLNPRTRSLFWAPSTSDDVLAAFAVADLLVFVVASALAAGLVLKTHRWAQRVLWFAVGGIAYAAFFCVASAMLTGEAWLAAVSMLLALAGTSIATVHYRE